MTLSPRERCERSRGAVVSDRDLDRAARADDSERFADLDVRVSAAKRDGPVSHDDRARLRRPEVRDRVAESIDRDDFTLDHSVGTSNRLRRTVHDRRIGGRRTESRDRFTSRERRGRRSEHVAAVERRRRVVAEREARPPSRRSPPAPATARRCRARRGSGPRTSRPAPPASSRRRDPPRRDAPSPRGNRCQKRATASRAQSTSWRGMSCVMSTIVASGACVSRTAFISPT